MSVQPSPALSVTTTPGAPVTAVVALEDVITLAVADGTGAVHVASSNPFCASGGSAPGWGLGWFSVGSDPITVAGAPISAVVGPDGTYTLCMTDISGTVRSASAKSIGGLASWSSVSPQSGISPKPGAPVTAVMAQDGSITAFVADTAGDLWSATSSPYEPPGDANPVWGGWTAVAPQAPITTASGAPVTAVAGPDGSITLFVADSGGVVWAAGGHPTGGWGDWTPVSPHTATTTAGAQVTALLAPGGTFTVFMADATGEVRTTSGDVDGGWGSPWTSVSQGSTEPGAPVNAVLAGDGTYTVFLANPDGYVFAASGSQARGWGDWTLLSGQTGNTVPGASITAVMARDGISTVCMAAASGEVQAASGNATRWTPWETVLPGTAPLGAPVTAVAVADGDYTVFVADHGGVVRATLSSPSVAPGSPGPAWGAWTSLPLDVITTPGAPLSAVVALDGLMTVFVADRTGGVWAASGNPTRGWGDAWSSVAQGSTAPGAPVTAVLAPDGLIAVFLANPGGSVFTALGSPTVGWGEWWLVSAQTGITTPGAPVTALVGANGLFTLFVADTDGQVHTISGNFTEGWGGSWTNVGQRITNPGAPVTAMVAQDGLTALFLTDSEGSVVSASESPAGGWGMWSPVSPQTGTSTPGSPVTAVLSADGIFSLFVANTIGEALTVWGSPTDEWVDWTPVSPGSGDTTPGARVTAMVEGTVPGGIVPDGIARLFLVSGSSGDVLTASGNQTLGWGQGWSNVSTQADATTPDAAVSVVVGPGGIITLFVADPGGNVYSASGNLSTASGTVGPGWGTWSSVSQGSTAPGAPITAVAAPDGIVTVFLADPGGNVFTAWGTPVGGWGDWTPVSPQTATTLPGAPLSACLATDGTFTLFMADASGEVRTASGSAADGWGAGWGNVAQGSTLPGAPVCAVPGPDGIFTLFLADPGGGVFTASGNAADGWGSGWAPVSPQTGTTTPGAPITAVLGPNGVFTLFMVDPVGGQVRAASGNRDQGWGAGWSTSATGFTSPGATVTALSLGPDEVIVFGVDPEGSVWSTSGNHSQGWPDLINVTPGGTTTPGATVAAAPGPDGMITLFLPIPGYITLGWGSTPPAEA